MKTEFKTQMFVTNEMLKESKQRDDENFYRHLACKLVNEIPFEFLSKIFCFERFPSDSAEIVCYMASLTIEGNK